MFRTELVSIVRSLNTFIHSKLYLSYCFYVLLTVYFNISLDNDQLDARLLYFILQCVHYNPLHVSSIRCSSSGD